MENPAAQERCLSKRVLANIYQAALRIRGERNRLEFFIRWTAGPVIGGSKPSSMVHLPRDELGRAWISWGEEICQALDVSAAILRQNQAGSLLLLYRRRMLQRALKGPSGRRLRSLSYPVGSGLDSCLAYLASRFADPARFPHEVGIFLGYPLDDVIAFCAGKLRPHDCRGYWKVYHRPEKAKRTFAYMDRARVKIAGEFFPPITKAIVECSLPHTSLGKALSDGIG